uniref:Uncharacterized protein n=1 Tax=Anguilla anguilla TaxID=7936 RepID=A0A0E9VS79_ANGAN
MQPTIHINYYH